MLSASEYAKFEQFHLQLTFANSKSNQNSYICNIDNGMAGIDDRENVLESFVVNFETNFVRGRVPLEDITEILRGWSQDDSVYIEGFHLTTVVFNVDDGVSEGPLNRKINSIINNVKMS